MADSAKRQHQDAARSLAPEPRGDAGRGGIEQGKAARQQRDRKGEQPGEDLGLDQEGLADPEQAGQEIAEAEPPADGGGGDFGTLYQRVRRCELAADSAPSISHTSAGSVSHSTGQTKNGAMASTEAAPAANAAVSLRHPRKPAQTLC